MTRALADLPDFPGEAQETPAESFRAKLLARDAETVRDRMRERLTAQLNRWIDDLPVVAQDDGSLAQTVNWICGAAMAAHAIDVISYDESGDWQRRSIEAWKKARAAR